MIEKTNPLKAKNDERQIVHNYNVKLDKFYFLKTRLAHRLNQSDLCLNFCK
jgi:hypothetical protein